MVIFNNIKLIDFINNNNGVYMKKLLLFLFSLNLFLFNIDINGDDNAYLINNPEDSGYYIINEYFSYDKLKTYFYDSDLSLISIRLDELDGYIRLEGNDINTMLESANNKIINKLGIDENTIKYKVGNYSVNSIKVYGKNKDIFKLLKVIHKE